jgi:hypothetical protein
MVGNMEVNVKLFHLDRKVDVSGISGAGIVADGVEFDDGQCVLSWRGRYHTVEILPNLKAVRDIHGHNGDTQIVWIEGEKKS